VELNRRGAPDVYLDMLDVHSGGREVCDHLVAMRRMPGERRRATLVRERAAAGLREITRFPAEAPASGGPIPRTLAEHYLYAPGAVDAVEQHLPLSGNHTGTGGPPKGPPVFE
jgi:hypothetical protein